MMEGIGKKEIDLASTLEPVLALNYVASDTRQKEMALDASRASSL